MKKKLLLIFGLVVIASSLFISCNDENTDNPPTFTTFSSPNGATGQVGKGEGIPIVFVAESNASSGSYLKNISIIAKYSVGGSETILDSTLSAKTKKATVNKTWLVPTNLTVGSNIDITVKITDEAGQTASKSFTRTVANLSGISEYINITLGAQGNISYGSAFASDSGVVDMTTDAKKWQARVDFLYIFDGTSGNAHAIVAPNDGVLASVAPGLISGWSQKNATKFKKISLTPAEFDAIISGDVIRQKWTTSSSSESSIASTLDDGSKLQQSYVVFKTVKTKYGIIQVTTINEAAVQKESSMIINVKVEE